MAEDRYAQIVARSESGYRPLPIRSDELENAMSNDIDWLLARVDRLREALEWYANPNRYPIGAWPERDDDPYGSILPDRGGRARAALTPGDRRDG